MIVFSCYNCGLITDLKEEMAGRSWQCPACGQATVVPATRDGPAGAGAGGGGGGRSLALVLAGLFPGLLAGGAAGYVFAKYHTGADQPTTTKAVVESLLGEPSSYVEAGDLYDEYLTDEADADRAYKGKVIEVYGTVAQRSAGRTGAAVTVDLRHHERPVAAAVQCFFDISQTDRVAGLATSQFVRIRGKCKGGSRHGVVLEQCEVVGQSKPDTPS